MSNNIKPLSTVIYSLEKMHFKVDALPDECYYIISPDGLNVFGCDYALKIPALRYFEECAYRYKRRNGLKKLREHLPEMVMQIKNNRWLSGD